MNAKLKTLSQLIISSSLLAAAAGANAAVVTLGGDASCNGNATDAGLVSFNGGSYRQCNLPAVIAVGNNTVELNKQNASAENIVWTVTTITRVGNGHLQGSEPGSTDETELKIQAGTQIAGTDNPTGSALVITRGATINAVGTASEPIVFSSIDDNFTGNDEWGGLILSSFGQSNQCPDTDLFDGCIMEGVDTSYYYGGGEYLDETVSSGSLNYIVIAEGGHELATASEINGLTLYAVNDETKINNVHVHNNLDDGIEFFGGDADVTNLWLTCNDDDSVDWDEGYTGSLTNVSITQDDNSGHAFELANNPNSPFTQVPVAKGIVNNILVNYIGSNPGTTAEPLKLKEGTDGNFSNMVIQGYAGVACDNTSTAIVKTTGSAFNTIEYDCTAVNGNAGSYMDLPASNPAATGFTQPSFWNAPACNL